MTVAGQQSRADDTHLLKTILPDLLAATHGTVDPPIDKYRKDGRGFEHPLTGSLLCPAGRDWNDPR